MLRNNPIVFITWGLLALSYLEFLLAKKRDLDVYSSQHTLTTIGLGIGNLFVSLTVIEALLKYIDSSIPNKLFTLPPGLVWGLCAFLIIDLLKYVAHRMAHQIGFLWAEHAVHHAAVEFNFTTHLRIGWLGFLSSSMLLSALFCLVGGLHTVLIIYFFIHMLVQTIAHTMLIHKLGFLESFHNYGNVFIIWDKLLGTFKPEGATQTTEFGLAYAPDVEAPLWKHAFFAWIDLIKPYANKALNASRI